MKVDIEVDTDQLYEGKVDKQGRKYLSRDLIGKNVTVAVVEVEDD